MQRWIRLPELDYEEDKFAPWMNYGWKDIVTDEIIFTEDKDGVICDPNKAILYDHLYLLFTDQAEYYAVCENCKFAFGHMQWSGHTHDPGWHIKSERFLKWRLKYRPWCQFCDPIFGSGGWIP